MTRRIQTLQYLIAVLAIAYLASGSGLIAQNDTKDDSSPLAALQYRFIGPVGNRAAAIVGEPGNPDVVYIGAASGGIFKTTDGGLTWESVFDHEDVAAVGALAIAPSAHNEIWAGTGEPWLIRPFMPMGDGVYRSTDEGKTWAHAGLAETGHIARIIVDPHKPDVAFVCAVGQVYRPQHERGIFKTTDGGNTWKQVLYVNDDTGCSELSMDAHDPQTLFAGMWQVSIHTWNLKSGGPGSGVYVSHDGGETWKKISGHGLPEADHAVGKVAVQVAPSDSNRVYALMEEETPRFYRSDDRGKTWRVVNQSHVLDERAPYYTRFAVSPDDENLIYFVTVEYSVSRDGGATFVEHLVPAGGDNHDVWIDPLNANRVLVAHDGGAGMSLNRGKSFQRVVLPIAQMYHVAVDNQIPYHVMGNKQDGPSYYGPSNNLAGGGRFGGIITAGDWHEVGGCESGWATPDPVDQNIIWNGCFDGQTVRMDLRTGQSHMVSPWPEATYGWPPAEVKYRWNWFFPLVISRHDHNRVYIGSQFVHMTTDAGQTWKVISPDLTTNDKSHQQDSGGVALDNPPGTYDGSILYAMADSPVKDGILWTGSNDGQVNVTRDGGEHWTNVTKNIPGLPPWGTVTSIETSHFDAGTAYITVNLQHVGNYDAFVYKTTDYGATWQAITTGIAKSMNSATRQICEDPGAKGLLYLGTDNAIYFSTDDGGRWTRLQNNLPPVPIYGLVVQPEFGDLVVGTHGRGFYILDDVTPLRQWAKAQASDLYLFAPRPAYRFRHIENQRARDAGTHVIGHNPPYGADFNYFLKAAAKNVAITILDSNGVEVRKLEGAKSAGLQRVWWDLRYSPSEVVKLRTSPPGQPWVPMGEGQGAEEDEDGGTLESHPPKDWRPLVSYGFWRGEVLAAPGKYTVQLNVDGKESTQTLEVLRDPHSLGSEQDIQAQTEFMLQLRKELSDMAEMINRLEWVRKQAEGVQARFAGDAYHEAAVREAKNLEEKAIEAQKNFEDVTLTGRREDSFRAPMKVYSKLSYLGNTLDGVWGGDGSDLPPTAGQSEVHKLLQQQMADAARAYKEFMETSVPKFNTAMKVQKLSIAIEP